MKYLELFVVIVSIFGLSVAQKYPTSCKGVTENQIVLLPNPKNCSSYIECELEVPVVMPCPNGLHWNDNRKQCDFPEFANCKETSKFSEEENLCKGVEEDEVVLLPNPKNCSTYILCTYGKPVVMSCPGELHWNDKIKQCDFPESANCKETFRSKKEENPCQGVKEDELVLLPNPGNCSSYILCAFDEPVVMACPDGLQWNDKDKYCDYPANANCPEKLRFSKGSCEGVPESVNLLLPNPKDCNSYIQCVHGAPLVRPCPPGLQWSVSANRCEWPNIANCKRNTCEGVPETVDVLLPNPEDCGTYIQCVHQQPVVRPCPGGLHWSTGANKCDWPTLANCENGIPS